ncbi:DUF7716 domain-containing protein [Paenibacillus bovis]|uniref:DUF7716 domain-containing protein n=1 Tax=Paenibacillus bovis TaxID=1616788 RepID=A0A172ZES3_9BACL|nr:hypothetical protein [Paenibacillus bovis]ANF96118.1 hypothetical protein AR543_08980 [Paenibacillus bovis]
MSRYEDRMADYKRRSRPDSMTFAHLQELVAIHGQLHNEWLYTNVDYWEEDPLHTPVYYFSEEWLWEQEEQGLAVQNDREDLLPAGLANTGIQTWLELATFEDIIDVLRQAKQPVSLTMNVMALKHYYKYDAFLDYDQAASRIQIIQVLQQVAEHKQSEAI